MRDGNLVLDAAAEGRIHRVHLSQELDRCLCGGDELTGKSPEFLEGLGSCG
jgi:hypothetical protein